MDQAREDRFWAWSVGGLVAGLLWLAGPSAMAQVAAAPPDPNALFQAGLRSEDWARNSSGSLTDQINAYQRAVEQYRQATQVVPDFFLAHARWALCLTQLARLNQNPRERQDLAKAARREFVTAAHCTGAEWIIYVNWGTWLTLNVDQLASDVKERRTLLEEASRVLQTAVEETRFKSDRASIEETRALCFSMRAQDAETDAEKRSLYAQAIDSFEATAQVKSEEKSNRLHGPWGVALMNLGKLNHDLVMLHQATERIHSALETDPNNPELQYNLACAYNALKRAKPTLYHLAQALKYDTTGNLAKTVAKNEDFAWLRNHPDFEQLLDKSSRRATESAPQPRISGR